MAEFSDVLVETLGGIDFDPDALKEKYLFERDKRVRSDANEQYIEVTGDFSSYVDDPYEQALEREPVFDHVDVAIVGGGFAGLLMGGRLRENGFDDVRVIEKGGDFGGTWYWNRYPGAMCDVESYCYLPMLEELDYVPKHKYSFAPEIMEHSKNIARHYNLYENALLSTGVTAVTWDDTQDHWVIETDKGDRFTARAIAMANGPLNRPQAAGHPGHQRLQGTHVPHQPVGLRLHRRQQCWRPRRPERQTSWHHWHRRHRGPMCPSLGRIGQGTLRVPTHAVVDRRPQQPRDATRVH